MARSRLLLILLAAVMAHADTVTTRDSSAWNGKATIAGGVVTLMATFRTGQVTLRFRADYVRAIDFNSSVYNPGQDPTRLLPKPNGGWFSGTIYLQNRTNQQCKKIEGSSGTLKCDDKPAPGVIRILASHTP